MQDAARYDDDWKVVDDRVSARVTELEALAPGPELLAGLIGCQGEPTSRLDVPVRLVALWARFVAWTEAQSMQAWSDALGDGEPGDSDADRLVNTELACVLHVGYGAAAHRTGVVRQVRGTLPHGYDALAVGELSPRHVGALAAATATCTPEVAGRVEAVVVAAAVAKGWTPAELTRAAAREVIAADPDGAADRADTARRLADVRLRPEADEQATLTATGDATTIRQVMDAVDTLAADWRRDGDTRPIGMLRVAALAHLTLGPTTPGSRPGVQLAVTVDLATLLGLRDHPADLAGYGPITAATGRTLARHAELRRLITDPITGRGVALDTTAYRLPAALARLIDARDRTCRFPGCSRPAARCDHDHITNHDPVAGNTTADNLHCLCRMHHNLKTRRHWHVTAHPDGTETWTSPLGLRHTSHPEQWTPHLDPPPDTDPELHDLDPHSHSHTDPPDRPWWLDDPPPLTDDELLSDHLRAGPHDDLFAGLTCAVA